MLRVCIITFPALRLPDRVVTLVVVLVVVAPIPTHDAAGSAATVRSPPLMRSLCRLNILRVSPSASVLKS